MGVDTGRLRVVATEGASELPPRPDGRRRGKPQRAAAGSAQPAQPVQPAQASQSSQPGIQSDIGVPSENTEGFTSPGPYLKAQRKRRGMSLDQLAAATKIPRPQLELLEADRYEELPGMVFTKGFLRCCARALELDPDTVLGLLYERERTQLRKRRREGAPDDKPISNSRRSVQASPASALQARIQARIADWLSQLPSARILMWVVVALLVALVVFIAFTLASGQAQTMTIRS
jgi:transcriptional regulator with XRE-family HTH domain